MIPSFVSKLSNVFGIESNGKDSADAQHYRIARFGLRGDI